MENDYIKKDCFAYTEKISGIKECNALDKLYCKNEKYCSFYQTREQLKEKRERLKKNEK